MSGERKLVTVLFMDVVGSTRLAQALDPEDWKALINTAFERMAAAVHRYEGTIAQFLGDGFLAFFGAPLSHEDDAARAVRAAIDLLDTARQYAEEVRLRTGLEFAVRIGINTGQVVVGPVGTDLEYEYLAVGDAVNLAARLQSSAEPMTALISEHTRRVLPDGFELRDLGPISIRGRTEATRVFAVGRSDTGGASEHRAIALSSPMIGRENELAELFLASDATRAGVGRLVAILGDPGIGKSRLLREWRAGVAEHGIRWAQANAPAHGASLAYYLAAETVRAMLALPADADAAALERALHAMSADDELLEAHGYLAQLLSIPLDDEAAANVPPLSPLGRQARYFELMRAATLSASREPTLLVLNDVHWCDRSSVALVSRVLTLHAAVPLLICLVARPDRDAAGWRLIEAARETAGSGLTEISLQPLPAGESRQLAANLLETDALEPRVAELIHRRAEGNPLFVEEMVHLLVEERATDGDGAEAQPKALAAIPDTLQGLLSARIDRLEPDARTALLVASVIGRQFSVPVLERVLERTS